jgi:hypothetical protein
VIKPGRFVLVCVVFEKGMAEPEEGYVTSWDTWDGAWSAFENNRMPAGFRLTDTETGRRWLPGARYEWEDAQT